MSHAHQVVTLLCLPVFTLQKKATYYPFSYVLPQTGELFLWLGAVGRIMDPITGS